MKSITASHEPALDEIFQEGSWRTHLDISVTGSTGRLLGIKPKVGHSMPARYIEALVEANTRPYLFNSVYGNGPELLCDIPEPVQHSSNDDILHFLLERVQEIGLQNPWGDDPLSGGQDKLLRTEAARDGYDRAIELVSNLIHEEIGK